MIERVSALVAGALGLAWVRAVDPHRSPLVPCPFHALTGLSCPACGTTRLVHDLLHGDVAGAWRDNALVLVLSPVLLGLVARWFVRGRDARVELPRGGVPAVLAVAVAWTVLRNA